MSSKPDVASIPVPTSRSIDGLLRAFDLTFAVIGLIAAAPILLICAMIIAATSPGPAIFAQTRVGRRQALFVCYKLRTMRRDTPSVASHEMSASAVTGVGRFLRTTKLDELPQLWNVLTGEMSLVGPRPCLPVQTELIAAREALGVYDLRPGVTGVAQVQGVDMSEPQRLAKLDAAWIEGRSVAGYFKLMVQTVGGAGRGDRTGA